MKQQTPSSEKEIQQKILEAALNELSINAVQIAQCASLCSLFITGSYISATVKQLVDELIKRHNGILDASHATVIAKDALQFGVENDLFQKEDNKYTPTESGWFIGKDWEQKLRLGWDVCEGMTAQ
jgi:hypothetical protein